MDKVCEIESTLEVHARNRVIKTLLATSKTLRKTEKLCAISPDVFCSIYITNVTLLILEQELAT